MMKLFDVLEKNLEGAPKEESGQPPKSVPSPNAVPVYDYSRYSSAENQGLSSTQAADRLEKYGLNELRSEKKISPVGIFFAQYKDIMTLILLVCTAVSLFMGEYVEAIAIAVIVLMNGILGFLQEYRTEKTLEALKNMAAPMAKVFRDGRVTSLHTTELVPGDVILLETGDKIPADVRILEAVSLECDESMLTGESIPVKKHAAPENGHSEKETMAYMGCVVTKGHCRCLVTATGMDTEMGNIASMLQTIDEESTPLQKRLAQLSKYIAVGCLLVCAIVSVTGILRGENVIDMLITGVSLAVAAVPEGLTAVVTICLALSVSRMVKRNALVRRLHAVETLGCATVICTDKTGTITQNRMTATDICLASGRCTAEKLSPEEPAASLLLKCVTLCNNATISSESGAAAPMGGSTEIALLQLAKTKGLSRQGLEQEYRRLSEQPFDSTRKRMSVVVEDGQHQKWQFVKGAFDILLDRCVEYQDGAAVRKLLPGDKRRFMEMSGEMADGALRVIGAAYKRITPLSPGEREDGLIFIGMVGMIDPPRPEVRQAVTRCYKAGIKTIMITGDHKKTAAAIARQVGIYHEGDLILTGEELDQMDVVQLSEVVGRVSVFARVSPSHKLQIVKALKRRGHIVAMTGDGVNDAPAVKEADIGVSMGKSGTDVTKEASEIILLDDNFATLVNAVDEGRSIYANIRKFIRYLLSCNIGEVLTMFLGMLMGMPVILFPIQILLVNLVTDGLPAIALGLEPSDSRAMSRPPRKPGESVFSNGLAWKIVIRGIFIGLATLASFVTLFNMTSSEDIARTGALFALIFAQLIHVFECKSEEKNILHIPYFDNMKLVGAAALSLITLLVVLYIPFLQNIFSTMPLTFQQLLVPIGYCFIAPVAGIFFNRSHDSQSF